MSDTPDKPVEPDDEVHDGSDSADPASEAGSAPSADTEDSTPSGTSAADAAESAVPDSMDPDTTAADDASAPAVPPKPAKAPEVSQPDVEGARAGGDPDSRFTPAFDPSVPPPPQGSPYPANVPPHAEQGSSYPPQGSPFPQHGSLHSHDFAHAYGPNGSAPAQGAPFPPPAGHGQMPPVASKYLSALSKGVTWRSALIPPGLALLAGLVVSIVLSMILTSMADFDTFAEDSGISLDSISYALPFIILALSLFGSAVFRFNAQASGIVEASGSIVLLGAPLLVTIVFVGVLWWFTKRSELKSPSPNRGTTWIRIGITSLSATLVLFMLQLIFAARFSAMDGSQLVELEFSAVTARSFFLPMLVILITSIAGRVAGHFKGSAAVGAVFLRRLVPPLLVTSVHLLVATALLSAVALFVLPFGLDAPWQVVPVVFINMGLILSMLVHFGGVSASAQGDLGFYSNGFSESLTIFSQEAPGQLWIGLLVVVIAILVSTLVSTVTRRPYWTVAGEDEQQWSSVWQVPLAFCVVWGLVSVLAVPFRASMEGSAEAAMMFDGAGAARFGVGPLAWSFLIFALWGAVIEVLSRTVGARLVLTFPAIAKLATGRAIHPYWGQTLGMSEPRFALIHPDAVADSANAAPAEAIPSHGAPPPPPPGGQVPPAGQYQGPYPADSNPSGPGSFDPSLANANLGEANASGQYATAPHSAGPEGTPPYAVPAAKPFDKRKATIIGVASGSVVVLIVAALIAVNQVNTRMFSPEAAVEKYFSELSDGDAEAALKIADVDVAVEQRQLLTNDVLGASKALPQNVTVEDADVSGSTATVSATYDVGGSKGTSTFTVHKAGKKSVFFDEWRLQAPELVNVYVDTPGLSTVKVNGVDVDTDGSALSLPAFPGMYTVGLAEETDLVSADAVETRAFFADSEDLEGAEPELLAAQPTDAFRSEVDKQVKTLIDSCAKKTVAQPDGCPFGSSLAESYEARNIKWSISSYPTVTVATDSSSGGSYYDSSSPTGPNGGPAWPISSETTGEAFVTGSYDSWSDETETFDDTDTFSVDGTAEIVDGKVVITITSDPFGF